ncbi:MULTISPECIES: acetyl/propionyl/methylcrotonyl-CoA carboxylase subunit alpha [unclassified Shewanella]|uniref:acetyl/propionyl/methylcrotonyl-CoA carboxylase subunit alpha n=1 Tax=unclassified Shewanella TaxID=196818 RepID=UPI000C85FB7D|nr:MULTISPECIES: acetyl/propionyl/methylcrotonyl-CoA carboxylase subunit alpha [unclassified Shewanella]MDO6620805.1 acetyl/propionyl/methylcrotonyl-CoA carboxylase subunit alpha [Shewanella sp. 6_MG-2023]PMG41067.1 3-methylcrotonyl-CoA carboxylase [Shewanella sp. 10N.286.52.B9]PMH97110.1 3-methylcrotonyl-CoA carboxylase [Shewanella sp. 10N.286.48.A6]
MFTKILIANRGEIACRIINTARAMGVRTVALYSDADKDARHVTMADESFHIGGSAPADSYLKADLIIEIAKKSAAEAIHPGYGFLSENADFARNCEQNGIVFIGPGSDAIDAMGSKSAAKMIMGAANVPLVPGYHGDDQSDETLLAEAENVGYPMLIKAAYGGGGKGMKIVESQAEVLAAINSARREAASSFGNDKLLMERYLRQPRHVELQVFADTFGNTIYLSDRDCSIQRRHQKVVEEAPAPGLSDALRKQMGEAAVAAAKAIDYVGAGTVEFLLDTDGSFYFMEMNTRLQVEHPVTEMVTGQDLVKWQLMVASGSELPLTQAEVRIHGHAFEARIYAEDPRNEFLPASGKLTFLREPDQNRHVRIDSGIRENDVISNFYDPMISKLIVWDESRPRALQRLTHALSSYQISGLKHNIEFLANIAEHKAFSDANFCTDFIERYSDSLIGNVTDESDNALALAGLYQVLARQQAAKSTATNSHDPYSPWGQVSGFRLNSASVHHVALLSDSSDEQQLHNLVITDLGDALHLNLNGQALSLAGTIKDDMLQAEINGHKSNIPVSHQGDDFTLFLPSGSYHFKAILAQIAEDTIDSADKLKAPMNGTVVTHLVEVGDSVTEGQGLLVMEAMKMEYTIEAPFDGVVSEFYFQSGELVTDGAQLLNVEPTTLDVTAPESADSEA